MLMFAVLFVHAMWRFCLPHGGLLTKAFYSFGYRPTVYFSRDLVCQMYGNRIPPIGWSSSNIKLNIYGPNEDCKFILLERALEQTS
jgi:hypothetical protein